MNNDFIPVGKILSSHGLSGCVKIKSFTHNPNSIFEYKNIVDEDGKVYEIKRYGNTQGNSLVACIKGVTTREEADKLRNKELFLKKSYLPKLDEGNFYINDLKGLTVKNQKNDTIGTVHNIINYGAGDIIEIITQQDDKRLISFNNDAILNIDLNKKELLINEGHLL